MLKVYFRKDAMCMDSEYIGSCRPWEIESFLRSIVRAGYVSFFDSVAGEKGDDSFVHGVYHRV